MAPNRNSSQPGPYLWGFEESWGVLERVFYAHREGYELLKSGAVLFFATDSNLLFAREEHGWVNLGHVVRYRFRSDVLALALGTQRPCTSSLLRALKTVIESVQLFPF